jgi:hypothetical protein
VTDNTSWQPPAGDTPPAQPVPSPFGPPSSPPSAAPAATPFGPPPGSGQQPPQGGPGWAPPGAAPGWTPPPKPGLIPLRPLTLGTLLGASFQVLRRNPRPMFGFALLLTGFVSVMTLLVVGIVGFLAINRTLTATGADADTIAAGAVATMLIAAFVPVVLSIVVTAILQGVVVLEVARGTLGQKLKLSGLWRAARGRIGALVGWSLLLTAIVVVALGVVALLIGVIVAFGGAAGVAVGVLLGIFAVLGAVVIAFWLGTRIALVPSVLMLERLPLRAAIARSWSLTTGYFWKTLGIQLLVAVIVQVVSSIITTPLNLLASFGTFLVNPNGDETGFIVSSVVLSVVTVVVTIVFGAIAAVVQSATTALIYIDLRMRKEGLDLELSRFVEARQAGDTSVADPYLPRAAPGAAEPGTYATPAPASPWS